MRAIVLDDAELNNLLMLGLAKGGFSGLGALSLPMLALAIDPVRAAAILLPKQLDW